MAFSPPPPPNITTIPRQHGTTQPEKVLLLPVSHRHANLSHIHSTILTEHPDAVMVELCHHRRGMLHTPRPLPGSEFSVAHKAANQISATTVLGDLPFPRTLTRAFAALSWRDRLTLFAGFLVASLLPIPDPRLLRAVVTADASAAERYVTLLNTRFPALGEVLVRERDMYMAWCVRHSQAVKGKRCVLAVLGAAHIPGVIRFLEEDDALRQAGRPPRLTFRNVSR